VYLGASGVRVYHSQLAVAGEEEGGLGRRADGRRRRLALGLLAAGEGERHGGEGKRCRPQGAHRTRTIQANRPT